jgi:radical SAM superfamily enzyme YgiQ (UPF0313 family)
LPLIGNLICLTPRDSYVVDDPPLRNGVLGRLERSVGPFVRSPGIGFPYLVGFLRRREIIPRDARVVVQHDKIEGATPFAAVLRDKADIRCGDHDVLFITAYTNSVREAYRRAREARAVWAEAGRPLTVVLGGPHASACPEEGTRRGHVDATVVGEGEWAAATLLTDLQEGRPLRPVYRAAFDRIRDRGTLVLDTGFWDGLARRPQQIVASTTFARGCKLDCHFCAVHLTNGPTVRNRDVEDVVDEIRRQGPRCDRDTLDRLEPGFYNGLLKAIARLPFVGRQTANRLVARIGPGFSNQFFFWDDNLYNAAGSFKALCEAVQPLGRPWSAELTIDLAERPDLLKAAYDSGCRDLFLGIESVSQSAIDGLDKWSNDTHVMKEHVRRVHDAGINVMGAFVFGLPGDGPDCFDRTLDFVADTGIDFIVANIIQPYPGTGTFRDAVAGREFLPEAGCPADSDTAMDYNWPLFDGAHVLLRPKGMTVDQLQEGYYYFLQQAYSLRGIMKRHRRSAFDLPAAANHFARNYLLSRYGMIKTAHALKRPRARVSPAPAALPSAAPATSPVHARTAAKRAAESAAKRGRLLTSPEPEL